MRRINWGIMGTGNIAHCFAKSLKFLKEDACLYGVGSRTYEKAEQFAGKYEIPKVYGSYEELAADEEIDIIYIAVPHGFHKECAALCMNAGKSVLCEKPVCLDLAETEELVALAREKGVFFMEAMWTKFLPVLWEVREEVKKGAIGDLLYIDAAYGARCEFDEKSRMFNKRLGGGALLDVGIYPLTFACFMMEKMPDRVQSSAILGKTGVDEVNALVCDFDTEKGPVVANIRSAVRVDLGGEAWIHGTKGKIQVKDFYGAREAVIYESGREPRKIAVPHQVNGYEYETMAVNTCLQEGKKECELHTWKAMLDMMKLMDTCLKEWGVDYKS